MVQAEENWSDVCGQVAAVRTHPQLRGHCLVELRVDSTREVPGFRDLLSQFHGQTLSVAVPNESIEKQAIQPGHDVCWRLRLGGPSAVFAHPDLHPPTSDS